MPYFLDKEYHPVLEDFITSYTDGSLDEIEAETFEELLFQDDDLRELTFAAIEGKKLLEQFRQVKAKEDFIKRLNGSLSN